jgi:hypothetical protein
LSQIISLDADRGLFNNILDNAGNASVNSATQILNLASIADRVVQVGLGQVPATALTAQDLQAIGLSGVSSSNLSRVLAAIDIAVTGTDAGPIDTLAEVQTLIHTVNWLASTATAVMAEAANGVSAQELVDGLTTVVTMPAGASVNDVLTLSLKDPKGNIRSVTHALTAQDLANGSITLTVPPTALDSSQNGNYTLTSTIARQSDGLSTADSVSTFVLDTVAPILVVSQISGDAVSLPSNPTGEFDAEERGTVLTSVATPVVIQGTTNAEAGQTFQVTLNELTYTALVQAASGGNTWAITLPTADAIALNHGNTYDARVQVSDVAGNPTAEERFSLFVNTAYPDVPTVDNLFTHGTLQGQAYAATPVLTGQAAKLIVVGADPTVASNYIALAGSDQITISVGGQTITGTLSGLPAGLSYNAANKTWSLNTSLVSGFTALADGTYNVSVTVVAGGVTKEDLGSNELQIQSTPPT